MPVSLNSHQLTRAGSPRAWLAAGRLAWLLEGLMTSEEYASASESRPDAVADPASKILE